MNILKPNHSCFSCLASVHAALHQNGVDSGMLEEFIKDAINRSKEDLPDYSDGHSLLESITQRQKISNAQMMLHLLQRGKTLC